MNNNNYPEQQPEHNGNLPESQYQYYPVSNQYGINPMPPLQDEPYRPWEAPFLSRANIPAALPRPQEPQLSSPADSPSLNNIVSPPTLNGVVQPTVSLQMPLPGHRVYSSTPQIPPQEPQLPHVAADFVTTNNSSIVNPPFANGIVQTIYCPSYLIEKVASPSFPLVIASEPKCLTTGIAADFAVSLAEGSNALTLHSHGLHVPSQKNVLYITDDIEVHTTRKRISVIQKTGMPVRLGRNALSVKKVSDCEFIPVTNYLRELEDDNVEDLCFDCKPPTEWNSYQKWVFLIREIVERSSEFGIVPIILLPLKNNLEVTIPGVIDIDFPDAHLLTNQFLFVTRAQPYEIGSGIHHINLISDCYFHAGANWTLKIKERNDRSKWIVEEMSSSPMSCVKNMPIQSSSAGSNNGSTTTTRRTHSPTTQTKREAVWDALQQFPQGETRKAIETASNVTREMVKKTIEDFISQNWVLEGTIQKPGGRIKMREHQSVRLTPDLIGKPLPG